METQQNNARYALNQAVEALRRGDRAQTRRWASLAARLDPTNEQPWLIMASVAAPQASIAYLKIALEKNPQSQPARRGMQWAVDRQRKAAAAAAARESTQPVHPAGLPAIVARAPLPGAARPAYPAPSAGATQPLRVPPPARRPRSAMTWVVIAFLVLLSGMALVGFTSVYVVMARSSSAERAISMLFKPSLTPTNTVTPTPTATATATVTPTVTETPLPTETTTPMPTDTPLPTETPYPTATPEPYVPGLPEGVGLGDRWIDVDLTNQRTYAYEGTTLVNAFVVSTGTWQHPTVTGTYQVYVKYTAADMSGPGYYLADVPYVMYFYKGYGLHGTYWHNNFGTPMSHGCVNLPTPDAGWLFDWASVGTIVYVHY